jgi:hypothetical protein
MKMKLWKSSVIKVAAVLFSVAGITVSASASGADLIKADYPVLITSFGQAPDGNTLSVLSKRIGAEVSYETLAPASRIKDFKTVIVSFGVSLKGFGAAGVNLDTEIARAKEIIDAARQNKVKLIGFHIGGEGRRDQMSNKLIEAYAGQMQSFVVFKDGNKDGLMTELAKKSEVPFLEIEKLNQVTETLKAILK